MHRGRDLEDAEAWRDIDRALVKPPPFVAEEDLPILRLLWAERGHDSGLRAFGRHGVLDQRLAERPDRAGHAMAFGNHLVILLFCTFKFF